MKSNQKAVSGIRKDDNALLFNLLIGAGMAVIMLFAIFNIGTYINGTISGSLVDSYGSSPSAQEQRTINTLENISAGYDDTLDIMIISAIIMAITLPLAAVVSVKKLL